MYCSYCGTELENDANFCSECGKRTVSVYPNEKKLDLKKPIKPDTAVTLDIINQVENLLNVSINICSDHQTVKRNLPTYHIQLHEEAVQKVLSTITLDKLIEATKFQRLGLIRDAGFRNTAQLLHASPQRLQNIRGVGEHTALQALSAARKVDKEVRDSEKIKIDPTQRTSLSTQLLRALYLIQNNSENEKLIADFIVDKRDYLNQQIRQTRLLLNSIRWHFYFKNSKNQSINSKNNLTDFLSSNQVVSLKAAIENFNRQTSASDNEVWNDFIAHSATYYSLLEQLVGVKIDTEKARGDLPQDLIDKVENQHLDTSLMKSTLRGYQSFGAKYAIAQEKSLIGDEMGLGKTIEAIASIVHLKVKGSTHFLVVCPASVLINWGREVSQHTTLSAFHIHGYSRQNVFDVWIKEGGIAVTTYETIKLIAVPATLKIDMLIVDEAHYVKNLSAQRTQAVRRLIKLSARVLFLTGTPLENRVEEMKSLINHLKPEIASDLDPMGVILAAQKFKHRIAPVYLRRNREDVLQELPELIQMEEWVNFGPQEEARYNVSPT